MILNKEYDDDDDDQRKNLTKPKSEQSGGENWLTSSCYYLKQNGVT